MKFYTMLATLLFPALYMISCSTSQNSEGSQEDRKPKTEREIKQQECDNKNENACCELSEMFREGKDGPVDLSAACKTVVDSCERGFPRACSIASYHLGLGVGCTADSIKSRQYSEKACAGNWAPGCANLAADLMRSALPEDLKRAREVALKGCTLGESDGCIKLSVLYVEGKGGPIDNAKAVFYAYQACEAGNGNGCKLAAMELIKKGLTSQTDVDAAKQFATKFEKFDSAGARDLMAQIESAASSNVGSGVEFVMSRKAICSKFSESNNALASTAIVDAYRAGTKKGIPVDRLIGVVDFISVYDGNPLLTLLQPPKGSKPGDALFKLTTDFGTIRGKNRISKGSKLYNTVSMLQKGQRVTFSGKIFPAIPVVPLGGIDKNYACSTDWEMDFSLIEKN